MRIAFIVIALLAIVSCSSSNSNEHPIQPQSEHESPITKNSATAIAERDLAKLDKTASSYNVIAIDEGEFWHVIFEPRDKNSDNVELVYLIFKKMERFSKRERDVWQDPPGPASESGQSDRDCQIGCSQLTGSYRRIRSSCI